MLPNRIAKGSTCSATAGVRNTASWAMRAGVAPSASPARRINSTKSSV